MKIDTNELLDLIHNTLAYKFAEYPMATLVWFMTIMGMQEKAAELPVWLPPTLSYSALVAGWLTTYFLKIWLDKVLFKKKKKNAG